MLRQVTIANEAISVDVSRELGKMILAQVKVMQEEYGRSRSFSGKDAIGKLNDIINSTGMKFNLRVTSDNFLNAMLIVPAFEGHRGTGFTTRTPYTALIAGGLQEFIKMDLEKLQFSGKMIDEHPMDLYVTGACFDVNRASAEETTGLLLHEIGHSIDVWATLGDYIYLNYMLTEGIDVLLGNKRNVQKLEILDQNWLEKNLDPAERDAFINHRTVDGARRAIISAWKKAPRGYLFENNMASHKRDEQFADWFAARMGFARALATLNYKADKEGGVNALRKSLVSVNVAHLATLVIFLPFTILWMLMVGETTEIDFAARYDSPFDRPNRLRLELIAQLKSIKDTSLHAGIMRDIEIIDDLLKQYNKDRTLMDFMADLSSPVRRREKDQLRHEQNLESLLNNDLFVAAKRFNS